MKTCPHCAGVGKVRTASDDEKTGAAMRKLREAKDISLRELGKKLGRSAGNLCDLEHGRRAWNPDLEKRYRDAVGGE